MSETEEPPAKVLKIDNFDQELSIPDIEPIGNGSTIPDGLGDAASVVDGEVPEHRLGAGHEPDLTGEIADNDLTDAESKETDQDLADSAQDIDKSDQDISDAASQLTDEILEEDKEQELDNTDQNADKLDQVMDKLDQGLDKVTGTLDQDEDKTYQDPDKYGQDADKLVQEVDKLAQEVDKLAQYVDNDQDASGSQEEAEGQEEWLSEGILTDDDLNNASRNHSEDDKPLLESRILEQNIEETLNHLEGDDEGSLDRKLNTNKAIKDEPIMMKQEPDDGNDTDDLLRMLGEDDQNKNKKKMTKTVKDLRSAIKNVMERSDDDDFDYKQTPYRKLKVAKLAISKKSAPKAVAEDMDDGDDDDTDQSSDEALATLKKTFNNKPNIITKRVPKLETQNLVVLKKASTKNPPVNVVHKRNVIAEKPVQKKSSSLIKPSQSSRSILKTSTPAKMVASKPNPAKPTRIEFKPPTSIRTPAPFRSEPLLKTLEIKKEEPNDEYLEEEDYVLNDDFESDIEDDLSTQRQRIMKPERMDEEIPSDGDSYDEDGSLYDELPSSESDDMDDWFQIDIRAERASEYIPLLGAKAKELLSEEKKRTSLRVLNLRQSLSALTESGKKQAEELRKATMQLAELDDMLKAS